MRVLITAGPTQEPIDPVRFLGNRSSGKMGYALAEAAVANGHSVTLISGPVALTPPTGLAGFVATGSSDEMFEAVHACICDIDVAILCAAVADFKPARIAAQKIKKNGRETLTLDLIPTRDILASLQNVKKNLRVIGFAAETTNVLVHAREKLSRKGCEAIICNDVSRMNTGFASDSNEVTVIFSNGREIALPLAPKRDIASQLLRILEL